MFSSAITFRSFQNQDFGTVGVTPKNKDNLEVHTLSLKAHASVVFKHRIPFLPETTEWLSHKIEKTSYSQTFDLGSDENNRHNPAENGIYHTQDHGDVPIQQRSRPSLGRDGTKVPTTSGYHI